jgi:hypothetical protein
MARKLWCLNGGPLNGDQLPAEDSDADGLVARVEQKSTGVHLGDYVLQRGAWRWHPAPKANAKAKVAQTLHEMMQREIVAAMHAQREALFNSILYGSWTT